MSPWGSGAAAEAPRAPDCRHVDQRWISSIWARIGLVPFWPNMEARGSEASSRAGLCRLLSKQVLCKPFGRWSGGGFEILHVGVKMATGQCHETLRLKRPLIGSQGQVSDREDITKRNHHHQRRRANKGGITSGLVLGEHLDRAEGNLILPGGRTAATSLGEPFPAIPV